MRACPRPDITRIGNVRREEVLGKNGCTLLAQRSDVVVGIHGGAPRLDRIRSLPAATGKKSIIRQRAVVPANHTPNYHKTLQMLAKVWRRNRLSDYKFYARRNDTSLSDSTLFSDPSPEEHEF